MPRPILSVPTPCHESWAAMTPAAQGRHCAACDKVVVDFTRMTDAELLTYLGPQAKGATCGRFRPEQLNRPLVAMSTAPAPRRWLAAALAILGLSVAGPATAQTNAAAPQEQRVLLDEAIAPTSPLSLLPPVTIRGRVIEQGTGQPLPGVTVLVPNTTLATSTAADGTFEIQVPRSAFSGKRPRLHIQATSIGYQVRNTTLKLGHNNFLNIELKMGGVVLGGLAFTPEVRSWFPNVFSAVWQSLRSYNQLIPPASGRLS